MMSTVNVNPKIMKRIQEHAEQNGCSVDELLTLWLGASEKEQTSILPFRNLLDQSPDIVALFDRDGRHLYVNPAIELVNSLTPDQMIGKTNRELSMPEDLVRYWEDVHRTILQNGAQHIIRFDFPTARGTRYYESVLTPLPGEDGSIEHILGVTRDVTSRVMAEETLKEERQLFISGPAVMFQWEDKPGWPVRYVSPNFEELFGYAPIEFMQERVPFSTIIHPLDLQGVTAEFSTYAREKKPFFQQEYRLRHKNGQYRWVREFTVVARDLQGRVKYYQGHLHDITEQREAQITLDEHHSQLNAFFESALDLLCVATLDGHFVRVNKTWETVLGYPVKSLEGIRFLDLVHPDDLEATQEALKDLSEDRPVINFVNRYRAKDGSYHYIEWRTQPHKGLIYASARDITERMQMEQDLRQSRERYKVLADMLFDFALLIRVDPDSVYPIEWSAGKLEEALGYPPGTDKLPPMRQIIHPDDAAQANSEIERTISENVSTTSEYRVKRADGEYIWLRVTRQPVWDETEGRVTRYYSAGRDITERMQMEQDLRQSQERYKALADMLYDFALLIRIERDGSAVIEWSVGTLQKSLGYVPDDNVPLFVIEMSHPDDQAMVNRAIARTVEHNEPTTSEYRVRRADGEYTWLRVSRMPIWDDEEGHVVRYYKAGQDITERKQMEEDLRRSEERLRGLINAVPDLIFRQSTDGTYLDYHAPRKKMMAIQPDAFMGKRSYDVLPEGVLNQVRGTFEQVVATQKPAEVEYSWEFNGEEHHFEARIAPSGSDEIFTIVRDVTRRKQAEQYALERERLGANLKKEQEINALIQHAVATLSHDIRTPLAVVATTKDILNRYYDQLSDEKRLEKLNTIEKQLHFVVEMLDDLVMIVKGSLEHRVFQPRPVNLKALCEVSMEEIRVAGGSNHRMLFESQGELETVLADETLITRMLLNLLSNAVKYSSPGSEIRLQARQQMDEIILRVIDQGIGIAQEDLQHIFKPFFRVANAPAPGTGLGLSIVHDCVLRHLGTIEVESELGRGSTFTIHLPRISKH